MKVKVLTLRWDDDLGGLDDAPLQAFQEGRTVVELAQHFVVHDRRPTLVLVLGYRPESSEGAARTAPARGQRPDPAAELDPAERRRFDALRTWRNDIARREGKPPYLFITNRQAAELARRPPATLDDLRAVRGIGESRIEAFGNELVRVIAAMEQHDQDQEPNADA